MPSGSRRNPPRLWQWPLTPPWSLGKDGSTQNAAAAATFNQKQREILPTFISFSHFVFPERRLSSPGSAALWIALFLLLILISFWCVGGSRGSLMHRYQPELQEGKKDEGPLWSLVQTITPDFFIFFLRPPLFQPLNTGCVAKWSN